MILPPGFVAVPLKGAVLLIPERVYVAGLQLGKALRRREAMGQRHGEREQRGVGGQTHADLEAN